MSLLKEDYMIGDYIFIYVKRGQEIPLLLNRTQVLKAISQEFWIFREL